jgi:hypothetical protein
MPNHGHAAEPSKPRDKDVMIRLTMNMLTGER